LEERETIEYQVEITESANLFYYELADHLYETLSAARVEEVLDLLVEKVWSLNTLFNRGTNEPVLSGRPQGYQYLLVERSKRKHVKIIYYVDDIVRRVYVTDFFPTEMDNKRLLKRNR
jgi:mRNA-degrading endonuclease RelE of RelBE toxin-antitoxin system